MVLVVEDGREIVLVVNRGRAIREVEAVGERVEMKDKVIKKRRRRSLEKMRVMWRDGGVVARWLQLGLHVESKRDKDERKDT